MIKSLLMLDESSTKYDELDYELRQRVGHEVEGYFALLLKNMTRILYVDEYNQLYRHLVDEKLKISLRDSLDFAEEKMKFIRYNKGGKQVVCAIEYVDGVYRHSISNTAKLYEEDALTNKTKYFLSSLYDEVSKGVFEKREQNTRKNGKYHYILSNEDEYAKE